MEYMTIGLLDKLMDKVSNEEKILELHSHLNDVNVDDIKLTFIQTAGEFREINIIFNPNNQGNLIPYFMKNNGYIYYDAKNFDNIKKLSLMNSSVSILYRKEASSLLLDIWRCRYLQYISS